MQLLKLTALMAALLFLLGCNSQPKPVTDPLIHGIAGTEHLGQDVTTDSAAATALANKINAIGTKGIALATTTKSADAIVLWQQILDLVDPIKAYASKLLTYVKDIDGIKADLNAGKIEEQKLQAELAAEKSEGVKRMHWIQFLAVFGVGAAVFLGFWLKNMKLSLAIGVCSVVMAVAAQLFLALNEAAVYFKWGLIGIAVLALVWILVEWKIKGSLKDALMTNPIDDLLDLFDKQQLKLAATADRMQQVVALTPPTAVGPAPPP